MKPADAISNDVLTGKPMTAEECSLLIRKFGKLAPEWFLQLCQERKLPGCELSLDEDADLSEMGVELKWMTASEMIEEASNFYPGIAALRLGYIPFGICLEGSGDPYFLKISDDYRSTSIVRIPHESIVDDELDESAMELVASTLVDFFMKAEVE